ncbi:PD-(D/E)XK nuclease family protein [Pyrobaculum calidifontis]|uniref:DUF3782 domain-containing protein n=1 Tax=Pyrobaculum calidifontis (strain DSM 21063 / JCM 11548 / VA1) TaxID=410359 RepID=A3MXE7_PYRCJ|nr:DUF3782 domain-containing protein [Pyrobaculum calidifontis]ABO09314.1 Protein of unknown function DUF1626 [Pyrobaculum calidifontis JCM 11548]
MFDKDAFLRLLREDEEFRYAVLGLLGLDKVFKRLEKNTKAIAALQRAMVRHTKALEEHTRAIEALQKTIEEHSRAINSMQKTLEEHSRVLERHSKAVESLQRAVEEHTRAIVAMQKTLEEHSRAIEGLQRAVEEHSRAIMSLQQAVDAQSVAIRELAAKMNALGTRWGVVAEEAFRESVKYLVEDLLGAYKAKKWTYYDAEGLVYGHPSVVEADLLVRDGEHILVEFKSSADRADVGELYKLGILYERVAGVKPKLLLVSPAVRKRAAELAKELGVEIRGEVVE